MENKQSFIKLVISCLCSQKFELDPCDFSMNHPSSEVRAMDWNAVHEELENQSWMRAKNGEWECPCCTSSEKVQGKSIVVSPLENNQKQIFMS